MGTSLHTVTVAQLRNELTGAELKSLPSAVKENATEAEVQAWLEEKLTQAADRVVGAINTCSRNEPIKSGLCRVPAECVHTVLVLARHAIISAIPGISDVLEGGSRSAEYATATRDLESLASCALLPEYILQADEAAEGGLSGFGLMQGEPVNKFRW